MAKKGMARPERSHPGSHKESQAVPELQGKAKHSKHPAPPIVAGTEGAQQKVWHTSAERSIRAQVYPVIDTDLGRDNLENDLPAADLWEL